MHPIYLDYAATTPVREEVVAAMSPYFDERFGNPSSIHRWGREASAALEEARSLCASSLGARPSEIHFTRGGTESDNLAVLGRALRLAEDGAPARVVVSAIEHKAVLDAAARAATVLGCDVRTVPVDPREGLDLDALDQAVEGGPVLASFMTVNNETGLRLPVAEAARRIRQAGGTIHTDAVQGVGKVPVDVGDLCVDLATVTGHKIYGPKGTGLIFVRAGTPVTPLIHGGGQERGMRPGTEDVAGAVGLATALHLAVEEQPIEARRLEALRERLEARIRSRIPDSRINCGEGYRAPHVCSLALPGIDGAAAVMALDIDGIAVSGGAACDSGASKGSHVIAALYGDSDPFGTVRISMGRSTTAEHLDRAVAALGAFVDRMRTPEADA